MILAADNVYEPAAIGPVLTNCALTVPPTVPEYNEPKLWLTATI